MKKKILIIIALLILPLFFTIQSIADNQTIDKGYYYNNIHLGNNEYLFQSASSPINYYDYANEIWKTIDTSIYELDKGHYAYNYGYRYGSTGLYDVLFKNTTIENYPIVFVWDKNSTEEYNRAYLRTKLLYAGYVSSDDPYNWTNLFEINNRTLEINKNEATYNNVFPSGIDLKYTYDSWQLKEEIILPETSKNALVNNPPSSFSMNTNKSFMCFITKIDFGTASVWNNTVEQINGNYTISDGKILFKDELNNILATMPIDYVYSTVDLTQREKLLYKFVENNDGIFLICGIKYNKLVNMSFPVVYDPTVSYGEYASQNGFCYRYASTWTQTRDVASANYVNKNYCMGHTEYTGAIKPNYYTGRWFTFHDTSSMPDDAIIQEVHYNFTITNIDLGTATQFCIVSNNTATGVSLSSLDYAIWFYENNRYAYFNDGDTLEGKNISISEDYNLWSDMIDVTGVSTVGVLECTHDLNNSAPAFGSHYRCLADYEEQIYLWIKYKRPIQPINVLLYPLTLYVSNYNNTVGYYIYNNASYLMNNTISSNVSGSWVIIKYTNNTYNTSIWCTLVAEDFGNFTYVNCSTYLPETGYWDNDTNMFMTCYGEDCILSGILELEPNLFIFFFCISILFLIMHTRENITKQVRFMYLILCMTCAVMLIADLSSQHNVVYQIADFGFLIVFALTSLFLGNDIVNVK